ncbi:hypothetical protein [Leifsonia sp. C5G2]|uniref:hypothetical protein n=1 Tax=Leifsonia sp. C5G2 TaxID=2735269 RepID=UPI001585BF2C|nr:hypothetical protein [Leifsonia sp. C5G2]NUU08589.1 hypothetical protein [Leifsonia sp. C5G2]
MAAIAHTLNLGDDDLLPAWESVKGLSEVMNTGELTIVGGLMVYLHATRGGITMPRSTDDADFLVDALVDRGSLTALAAAMRQLGFQLKDDERYAYRFIHPDGRKIDAMVPDHLPKNLTIRLQRKPALEVPAGQQALDRRELYQLTFNSGAVVTVGVPDEIGALVAKGAAYLTDQRDPGRHLEDAATLLASIEDASALDYSRSTKNDRARLRAIKENLTDATAAPWVNLDDQARLRSRVNLELVMTAMGVE